MQVLLAPLFFKTRFCKQCARIFYRENPGSWLGIHEFDSLPPLGCFESRRGFVPDYPALLMFDKFVVDGTLTSESCIPTGNGCWNAENF